ncbi:helix-turn-helix transcriptional regulator [Metabacillus sp. DBTR6]|uniref:Helix-turn-helix transcriptional regulator n=2 Tax=Metabacillus rhizolycopersici TaxID=2875709 RepID=A0ABS7UYX2_9BACI|nr:helix-turn-helix transcriptional regulator [Metabacillus rhizolycopersici]MBZ5753526.1 helix-turn-helix transcriptional regulator [Metabacillus rhizolycopersici]
MFGMGKTRTKIGKWLDKYGVSQEWLVKKTKLGRNTVSRICSDKEYSPRTTTIKKLMKAIREIDPNAKADDFFDM